jgi:hypothetical protein
MNEQNELLEAALKLAELVKDLKAKGEIFFEAVELIQTIEAHRPKPERLEGWVNVYDGFPTWCYIWATEKGARDAAGEVARQVQIREVVPVEWKPWTVEMVRNHQNFQETADAHNAEMERVTK